LSSIPALLKMVIGSGVVPIALWALTQFETSMQVIHSATVALLVMKFSLST